MKDSTSGDRDFDACLTLEEICVAATVERAWLVHRVEEGLVPVSGRSAADWRFETPSLARVRRMRDIERTYDAVPELAALVADLLEEMDALRAELRRRA